MRRLLQALMHPRSTARNLVAVARRYCPQSQARIATDAANFWDSSPHNSRVRDLSHWVGEGRWSAQEAWDQIGRTHFEMFERLCCLTNTDRPIRTMVEWGPGGGANAVWFAQEVSELYGIDISQANLAECKRQLTARGLTGFRPIQIDAQDPAQSLRYVRSPVDFFLSTAVYQHFPSKEYGVLVTELAYELLASDGAALIQIRYDDGSQAVRPKTRDYVENVVAFTSYPVHEFWEITCRIGLTPLAVTLDPRVRYAYYFLKKG